MPVRLLLALAVALAGAACGDSARSSTTGSRTTPTVGQPGQGAHSTRSGQSSQGATAATVAAGTTTVTASHPCGWRTRTTYRHVIWIWLENRTYSQVLGSAGGAVRLQSYAAKCGVATHYEAITHPSLPNYLAAVGGSTFGISSDCSPASCPVRRAASLFGQVKRSGRQWRAYAESMDRRCDPRSYGRYAARHNPAVYFTAIHRQCRRSDVAMGGRYGAFADALRTGLPAFSFVIPNLCHDGHDCSTTVADDWVGLWLRRIVTSRAYAAGHTAVFITWDEGVGSDNRVATVAVAPTVVPGVRVGKAFTHYSLLRTTEELLGLPLLRRAAHAPSMRTGFRLLS